MPRLLDEAESTALELGALIGAGRNHMPWFGVAHDDVRPQVLERDGTLVFLERDRGQVEREDTARDLDELLFWVFDVITGRIAAAYARKALADRESPEAIEITRQLALLATLQPAWAARWRSANELRMHRAGLHG